MQHCMSSFHQVFICAAAAYQCTQKWHFSKLCHARGECQYEKGLWILYSLWTSVWVVSLHICALLVCPQAHPCYSEVKHGYMQRKPQSTYAWSLAFLVEVTVNLWHIPFTQLRLWSWRHRSMHFLVVGMSMNYFTFYSSMLYKMYLLYLT